VALHKSHFCFDHINRLNVNGKYKKKSDILNNTVKLLCILVEYCASTLNFNLLYFKLRYNRHRINTILT